MNVVGLVDLVNDAAEDKQIYATARRGRAGAAAGRRRGAAAASLRPASRGRRGLLRPADARILGRPLLRGRLPGLPAAVLDERPRPPRGRANSPPRRRALPASTFSPFTTAEWLSQDENTEAYTGCVRLARAHGRPAARALAAAGAARQHAGARRSAANSTPGRHRATCRKVLAKLGGHAQFVEARELHARRRRGRNDLRLGLIRAFVADPDELERSTPPAPPRCRRSTPSASTRARSRPSSRCTPTAGIDGVAGRAAPRRRGAADGGRCGRPLCGDRSDAATTDSTAAPRPRRRAARLSR